MKPASATPNVRWWWWGQSDKNAYFSGISHTNSCFKQDYFDKVDRVCRTPGDDPEMMRNTIMYNPSMSATGM